MNCEKKPTSIVLIGFSASGKSTVGQLLAAQLKKTFLDLDHEVMDLHERLHGERLRCREILARSGREAFMRLELQCLDTIRTVPNVILATGGGAILHDSSRDALQAIGTVIYLKLTPQVIFWRLESRGMPRFLGPSATVETVAQELESRRPLYESLADMTVDADQESADLTAQAVIAALIPQGNA